MTALQVLDPQDNDRTGPVPATLGDLANLRQLVLATNDLSGPLPDSLGQLVNLGHLRLRDNNLSGQIPRGLTNLNIEFLGLSGNTFTGCLPTELDQSATHDLDGQNLAGLTSCAPTFASAAYTFSASRSAATGTAIGTASANPYEAEEAISYAITTGNDDGLFALDSATGALTLARAPAAADADTYTFTLQATDPHSQTQTAELTITLTTPVQ